MRPRFLLLWLVRFALVVCAAGGLSRPSGAATDVDPNGTWAVVPVSGTGPGALTQHGAIYDPDSDQMVVFGGADTLRNTWILSLGSSPAWTRVAPPSTPSGRKAMAVVYDPIRRRMLMFGGYDGAYRNDVWSLPLDGRPPNWIPLTAGGTPPTGRMLTQAIYDPIRDRMIVFGGHPPALNDVWALSLSGTPQWSEITVPGIAPSPRYGHVGIYDPVGDRLITFGGNNHDSLTWALSLSGTPAWTQLVASGPRPPARAYSTAVYDARRSRMVICGGTNGTMDVWALDLIGTPAWTQLFPAGVTPAPRWLHTAVYQPTTDRMIVFGGLYGGFEVHALTWGDLAGPPTIAAFTPSVGRVGDPVRVSGSWLGAATQVAFNGIQAPISENLPASIVTSVPPGATSGPITVTTAYGTGASPADFQVTVGATPPIPGFLSGINLSATTISFGQEVRITTSVHNDGGTSDDGRVVFSFPDLTRPDDAPRVRTGAGGDAPGYRSWAAGAPLLDVNCQTMTSGYLVTEYADDDWQGTGAESNPCTLTVRPPRVGTFAIDVRSTMHTAQGGSCDYANGLPANGQAGFIDQQGWLVRRFVVTVNPTPAVPVFVGDVHVSADQVSLGATLTITASVRNDGWASDDGRIVMGFPALDRAGDEQYVSGGSIDDAPGYREFPRGVATLGHDCQPVMNGYVVAEYADSSWDSLGAETNTLTVSVNPPRVGPFTIEVRSTMHTTQGASCEYWNGVPANGDIGPIDQQGWVVSRFYVVVSSGPIVASPTFVGNVTVSADELPQGEPLTITATVRNDGRASDDGRIVLGFPALDQPGDEQFVSSGSTGDLPGYREFPPGATMLGQACQPVTARYLTAEYADAAWDSIGNETNTLTVTVRPPREGLFGVEVRSTMRTAGEGPCAYLNGLPLNGQPGFTDQQGWQVNRFDVQVGSPSTVTWRQLGPSGGAPIARARQAAVYDPARDELMLYGGSALEYIGDSWTLPLPDNSNWVQLQPGGPVPLRRVRHSMIFDPVGRDLVIFGGFYDAYLNDLWVLSRSPVTWWFPITIGAARPSPRMGHAAVYDPVRQRMLVIGGFGGGYLNDVWEYSPMVNGTWKELTPAGTPMPPRCEYSAVYDSLRDRVVIFGGDGGTMRNDLWELRLGDAPSWSPITANGLPPSPRREHSAVYDAQWDEMIVFGGFDGTKRVNDVWTLSLSGTPRWERRFASSPPPTPRAAHSAVYDPVRRRMMMFGGQVGTYDYVSDVWELKIDQATPVALAQAETEVESDHVRLTWFGEGAASLAASVERSIGEDEWLTVGPPSAQGPDQLEFIDRDVTPGTRYGYRLRVWQEGKEEVLEPVWVTVPERAILSLAGASPNPVSDAFAVAFSLPREGAGAIELFDLRGRRVARHDLTGMGAGVHRVVLAEGKHLAAGVYLVRLTQGDRHLTAKACVVR